MNDSCLTSSFLHREPLPASSSQPASKKPAPWQLVLALCSVFFCSNPFLFSSGGKKPSERLPWPLGSKGQRWRAAILPSHRGTSLNTPRCFSDATRFPSIYSQRRSARRAQGGRQPRQCWPERRALKDLVLWHSNDSEREGERALFMCKTKGKSGLFFPVVLGSADSMPRTPGGEGAAPSSEQSWR